MSRSILVLSLPRSGSSCVAGVLQRLGVNMGNGQMAKPNAANPKGYYQDDRWTRLNGDVGGWGYSTRVVRSISPQQEDAYRSLITECEREPIWGIKHPRLCFVSQFIWPLLADPRMIVIRRPFEDMVRSLVRYSQIDLDGANALPFREAELILGEWNHAYRDRIIEFPGEMYQLDYYELLGNPEGKVRRLAEFCFEGTNGEPPNRTQMRSAVEFVDRGLRHF